MPQRLPLIVTGALALSAMMPLPAPASQSEIGRLAQLERGTLAQALEHLDVAIADARTSSGSAFRAFAALGISTFDPVLGRVKSAREVLYEMAERFAAMRDDAKKADTARVMLGPGWAALMPYLNRGTAGIKQLEELQPDTQ